MGPRPSAPRVEQYLDRRLTCSDLSGRRDLNPRPLDPQSSALPNCATARYLHRTQPPDLDQTRLHQILERTPINPIRICLVLLVLFVAAVCVPSLSQPDEAVDTREVVQTVLAQGESQLAQQREVVPAVLKRSENSKFFLVTPEGRVRWGMSEDALGALLGRSIGDGKSGFGGLGLRGVGGGGGGGIGLGGIGLFRPGKSPRVIGGTASVKGTLDKAVIRRVIRRHLAEVKYCYVTRGLVAKKGLKGTVRVQFIIGTKGYVASAKLHKTTLKHRATEQCILAAVRRWRFPKPEGGGIVVVTYPFLFKPPPGKGK